MMRILVTEFDPVKSDAEQIMRRIAQVTSTVRWSEAELVSQIQDVDGLLVCFAPVTSKVIEAGRRLKVITRFGVGYDNVDVDAATRANVPVINFPAIYTEEVAELTLLLILAVARRLSFADELVRSGNWFWKLDMGSRQKYVDGCATLQGKTLGLVGIGSIGKEVARKAQCALNMKVLAYDPYVNASDAHKLNIDLVNLERLLKESDVISIHTPLTESTRGLIARPQLEAMKPTAYLINTSRGPVVDETALINAIKARKIAGAGLEVFSKEPPDAQNPLLKMEQVVLTPHIGAQTAEASSRIWTACANAMVSVLEGRIPAPPANIVNKEVLKTIDLR